MTAGKSNPEANDVQKGTWAFHRKWYGMEFPYQDFAPQFRAELFDPDHWADVFHRSGAKYAALTSKHHDGFALWPSKEASGTWVHPWNAMDVGPKRDVLGDLPEAVPGYVREHMAPQFKDLVTRYKSSIIFSDGEWDLPSS